MTPSLTQALAQYAASTEMSSIPGEVVERAKRVIMDEMASACFGSRGGAGSLVARYASSMAGAGESRILGTAQRVAAPYAALANGAAGHSDDVDGTHVVGGHPGATIVHAAVAAAERVAASGAELINAVVLGYDVGTRVLQACGGMYEVGSRHHLHSDFLYALGATVAASRLLALDPLRHCHAMALVTFQVNGLNAVYQEPRHISKPFSNGQYAFAGVSAALMAAAGLEGVGDIIGTRDGLLAAWGADDAARLVTQGLGSEYSILGANIKLMSACYPIHAAAEAMLEMVADHRIKAEDISSVHAGLPAVAVPIVDNRLVPNTCIQDVLSAALLRGSLPLRTSPFPDILAEPSFALMRARIAVGVDPELEREYPNGRGSKVTIATRTGATYSRRVDWPRGHSRRGGASWEDLSAKWHDALPDQDVERMLALAQGLDELPDVRTLSDAFCRPG